MTRRIAVIFILLFAATHVHAACADQNYTHKSLKFYVVSIGGVDAQVHDVLVFTEQCHYLWHGTQGTYTYADHVITFRPAEGATPPYGGRARMSSAHHLYFGLDTHTTIEMAPRTEWWRGLCPLWPFC